MKRTLWAALAALNLLFAPITSAVAGGYYASDTYAGADLYVARTSVPVYDCPRPGCRTDIRLRNGSYIYAVCWDGGEGWCRVQTRYFKNMFLPRYAVDLANGGHRYRSYYSREAYPTNSRYKDCTYKEGYRYKDDYREGCYDKDASYPYKGGYGAGYKYRAYHYGAYAKEYGYQRKDEGSSDDYDGSEGED
jgi:hypothetical protein